MTSELNIELVARLKMYNMIQRWQKHPRVKNKDILKETIKCSGAIIR